MFKFTLHHRIQFYLHKKGHELFLEEYNDYIDRNYNGKRSHMNFIDNFLEYTKDAESPTSFLSWASLCSIAATMRDNVYLDIGMGQRLYANLYVILVARSGACRKGVPLKVSLGLLNQIKNTKIISGRTSIQAVVKTLSENITNGTPNAKGDYMIGGASGILYSEELAAFLVDDKATIPILTDLYDYQEEWTNNLKASDTERLKNVVLSMLAASNEDLLKEVYQSAAIYGGLLARTVIVMEQRRRQKNSRVRAITDKDSENKKMNLILHLRKIAAAKGRMTFDDEAADIYDEWYNSIDDENFGRSGIEARIHTTVQKVAMCLAMAEQDFDLVIRKKQIEEAITLCSALIPNYQFLTMSAGAGTNPNSYNAWAGKVLTAIYNAKGRQMSTGQILRKFIGQVDMKQLENFALSMQKAEVLEIIIDGGKEGHIYRAGQKLIEKFQGKEES